MYVKISLIVLLLSGQIVFGQDQILGKWLPEDKMGHIEIYRENNKYYGKIVCIKNPINPKTGKPWKDALNPDKSKRERPILGIVMMYNFKFDKKNNQFVGGKLYDVRKGRTFKGKMWIENGKLNLRGYWFMFYQTEQWTKVKSPCN